MKTEDNKDIKDDEREKKHFPTIKHLYRQIESVPQLIEKAHVIDTTLLTQFQEIRSNAELLLKEIDDQKKIFLQRFHGVLQPAAQAVLAELSEAAEELKLDLEESLSNLQETSAEDWVQHAKGWVQLYAKLQDHKELAKKVIQVASEHTHELIERDVKVIQDYQDHSLSNLPKESNEYKGLEKRLKAATEEALSQLIKLKDSPGNLSVVQTAEWIANLHQERQKHFENVLMKIDSILKDTVSMESDSADLGDYSELDGEIIFMERELHHINELVANLDLKDDKEVDFMNMRLKGLEEHLDQFELDRVPKELKMKVDKLYNMIEACYFRLRGI